MGSEVGGVPPIAVGVSPLTTHTLLRVDSEFSKNLDVVLEDLSSLKSRGESWDLGREVGSGVRAPVDP